MATDTATAMNNAGGALLVLGAVWAAALWFVYGAAFALPALAAASLGVLLMAAADNERW